MRRKIGIAMGLVLMLTAVVIAATPEAYIKHVADVLAFTSSSADYEGGDVIEYAGRGGIIAADIDYSVQPAGSINVRGLASVTCGSTTYWQAGEPVFWDSSANTAIKVPVDDGDFYLGLCGLAKSGSTTSVRVVLNEYVPQGILEGDIVFQDDFVAYAYNQYVWQVVDVNTASEALASNTHGGVFNLVIASNDEAEDAVLYFGDNLQFDIDSLKEFECRLAVTTPGSGVTAVWGLADAHNLDKDTVTTNAWFRIDGGSMVCDVETDDGTTDDDDNSTSTTLVTGTYYVFKIDLRDKTAVDFFINGVEVVSDLSLAAATSELQPYFSLDKASGSGTATLAIDWVRVVSARE